MDATMEYVQAFTPERMLKTLRKIRFDKTSAIGGNISPAAKVIQ